jgi:hypothetical protein
MNMQRCLLMVVICAVAGAAVGGDGPHPAQPALTVDEARIELGEIVAGQDAVATFTFRNHGAEDIRIIRAKPS